MREKQITDLQKELDDLYYHLREMSVEEKNDRYVEKCLQYLSDEGYSLESQTLFSDQELIREAHEIHLLRLFPEFRDSDPDLHGRYILQNLPDCYNREPSHEEYRGCCKKKRFSYVLELDHPQCCLSINSKREDLIIEGQNS